MGRASVIHDAVSIAGASSRYVRGRGSRGTLGGETPDPMDRSDGSGPEEAASAFGGEVEELFADLAGAQPRPMVPFTHE